VRAVHSAHFVKPASAGFLLLSRHRQTQVGAPALDALWQRARWGELQLISQRLPLFSALHELVACVDVTELVLPVSLELETVDELCELTEPVPLVEVFDSIELVTFVAFRDSIELFTPADWTSPIMAHVPDASTTMAMKFFMRRYSGGHG
jgi:hypothetical protein